MNEKNFPDDNDSRSLNELTDLANKIIENLENEKDLEKSKELYQKLLKLNNLIEKKFQINSKEITEKTKSKIIQIKKNEKKIKKNS